LRLGLRFRFRLGLLRLLLLMGLLRLLLRLLGLMLHKVRLGWRLSLDLRQRFWRNRTFALFSRRWRSYVSAKMSNVALNAGC
jgi:hypothetical protein